jgi:hypothetical protein
MLQLTSATEIEAQIELLVRYFTELSSMLTKLELQLSSTHTAALVQIELISLELSLHLDIHRWSELSEILSDLLCRIVAMNKLEEQIMFL